MGSFIKGDVVIVYFPFSDSSQSKKRPALVLTNLYGDDAIICQITSQDVRDGYSVSLTDTDFVEGGLQRPSNIRPNKLFTLHQAIIDRKVGHINQSKIDEVAAKLGQILSQ